MSNTFISTDYMRLLSKRTFSIAEILRLVKNNDTLDVIKKELFYSNNTNKGEITNITTHYRNTCIQNCISSIIDIKNNKRKKVSSENFNIPLVSDYAAIIKNNYSVQQLKMICRHYKQKLSGNKDEVQNRILFYMLRSCDINIIQNAWRKHIIKKYHRLRGPAIVNRKLCVNDTDFCSMDNLDSISYAQFFSYKDVDDKIYGFDITSLFTLLSKGNLNTTNPYNRKIFPRKIRKKINSILRIARIMNETIIIDIEEPESIVPQKQIEQRTITVFHNMDLLGNYTNTTWFTSLGRAALIRYIRELADIWMYRAQLTESTKREICPPYGNPFGNILNILLSTTTENLKSLALDIIEKMVNNGVNHASKCLGTNYVLCAFTLVNDNARDSLPLLYLAVA